MNILKKYLFTLLTTTLVLAPVLHAQDVQKVVDFRKKNFDYGYEGWKELGDVLIKADTGITITGPSKGGVGVYFPTIVDIIDFTTLEIKLKKGLGNTASKLRIKLMAASGGAVVDAPIDLAEVSDSEFTSFKIALPPTGKPEHEKLEEIKQLQIQGDFTPGQKVEVEFADIIATKTPVEAAK